MNRIKTRLLITIALMVGLVVGVILIKQFNNYADSCQIKYVSQEELMALEEERIKLEPLESRQLFFGKTTEAAKLAAVLPKDFEDSTTLVVYSAGSVSGKGVKSISREVHAQIIAELTKKEVK